MKQTFLCSRRVSGSLPGHFLRKFNPRGGTSDIDIELSSVDRPVMTVDVVVSEGAPGERDRNPPGFAGVELNLHKSLQFLEGTGNARLWFADVHFGNFGAGTMAGVGDV